MPADQDFEGKIVYASNVDGDYELFVMRADGSRVRQLTNNEKNDYDPSWSPDGRRIVFEREKSNYEDLFIIGARGIKPARKWITSRGVDEGDPEWSPDGKWIAFRGNDGGDGSDVVAVTVDKKYGRIVSSQDENSSNYDPTWSPDGTELALVESYDGADIYTASFCCSYGYQKEAVTDDYSIEERALDWSPDGNCILYSRTSSVADTDIFVIARSGGVPRLLFKGAPYAVVGSYSPDGSQIVFYATTGATYDLYIMNSDGTNVRPLTSTPASSEITPVWYGPTEPVSSPAVPSCTATPEASPSGAAL